MKKLVLTTICTLAVAGAAFAQGTVNWTGPSFTAVTAETNATVYSPLFGGGSAVGGTIGVTSVAGDGFYYELLYTTYGGSQAAVPTTVSGIASWSDTGLGLTNSTAVAGRLIDVAPNNGQTVPWAPGTTDSIVMVGWSVNLGTSWSTVLSELEQWTTGSDYSQSIVGPAYFGISNTGFTQPLVAPTAPGAAVFGSANTSSGKPILSLLTPLDLLPVAPVPEPTTLALATLGGASLLLFRRRK